MTDKLTDQLREYADIAEAGDKAHWATAMREAASQLDWPEGEAARRNGCTFDELCTSAAGAKALDTPRNRRMG